MSEKVVLRYFNGRGKMESIRWLLAAAGVQFEEVFLTKREEYEKLLNVLMKIKVIYLITMHALLQALYNLSFVLQASQEKIKALPTISKFLQPGSARKPPPDEVYVKTVMAVLSHLFKQEAQ
ncbi:glutathione S-transferase 3-like [Sinocyclocheilus grahami]|uniref:glutathione S-transferase 3-like n=1 Tax=Sinocyclocheilus grahami TaxID=75366 RepID=UPI0007ACD22E|nr:PREDICTED: glutathione S-transferase 3-like [Sinocyclocheilus grahami]